MQKKVGLFIGRFQPFHKGHIDALEQAIKHGITTFLIGVGSANKEHTIENPFTYEERKIMISSSLKSWKPSLSFQIFPLPDMDSDMDWKDHIVKNVPGFDMVISSNPWTIGIFKKAKIPVFTPRITQEIKATTIRHYLFLRDVSTLKNYVDGSLIPYMYRINAYARIQKLYKQEYVAPHIAVDGVVYTKDKKIVIIKRNIEPIGYALPGGFIEYGETPEQAFMREMKEELGVKVKIKRLLGVFGNPRRDPRRHTISISYEATIVSGRLKAGDDAGAIKLAPLATVKKIQLMFDHNNLLALL